MNKNIITLLIIFILPLFGYFYLSKNSQSSISVATTNRVQLIKFTSNMCSECKKVEPVVNNVMKKYQDTIQYITIPVQVNNKYNEEMMRKYNITLVPTIIILDKKQNVYKRIEGYIDEKTLDKYIGNLCK